MTNAETITCAAELLRAARHGVALTGAGISTPSGIPDFRSDSGLWHDADPLKVASLGGFRADPLRFYRWVVPLLHTLQAATPNPAHTALALLQAGGNLSTVITQNIDGLHQRAGSREVYELHGHTRTATCLECDMQVRMTALEREIARGRVPHCPCGGVYKPDVVLFDEDLPRGLYWMAQAELERCDVLLVCGTSLEVYPVNTLPLIALRHGAKMVIINKSPTHLDDRATCVVRADLADVLPRILAAMQQAPGVMVGVSTKEQQTTNGTGHHTN